MSQVILGLGKHVEVMLRSSFLISYHLTQYSTRKARPEVDQAMGLRREKKQKNELNGRRKTGCGGRPNAVYGKVEQVG